MGWGRPPFLCQAFPLTGRPATRGALGCAKERSISISMNIRMPVSRVVAKMRSSTIVVLPDSNKPDVLLIHLEPVGERALGESADEAALLQHPL